MLVVLDSTVLIDFLRGRPAVDRVRDLRARGDVAATTAINVEEVVRGLRPSEDDAAHALFDGLEIIAIGAGVSWQAGRWRREHAGHGTTLSQADCLIAAAAASIGGALATGNPRDFPMEGVVVHNWPVGQ